MHLALPSDAFNEYEGLGGDMTLVDMGAVERVYEGAWSEAGFWLTLGRVFVGLTGQALFGELSEPVAKGAMRRAFDRKLNSALEQLPPPRSVDDVAQALAAG